MSNLEPPELGQSPYPNNQEPQQPEEPLSSDLSQESPTSEREPSEPISSSGEQGWVQGIAQALVEPFQTMAPRSPESVQRDLEYGSDLRERTDRAFEAGDDELANELLYAQEAESFRATLEVVMEGGDPFAQTIPSATFIDPQIEAKRKMIAAARQEMQIDQALDENAWGELADFKSSVTKEWRDRHEQPLLQFKAGITPEEQEQVMSQFQPLPLNPDEVANMRQIVAKANHAMRQINPRLNVFNHPRTRELANWIQREGGEFYSDPSQRPYDYGAGYREFLPEWAAQTVSRIGHVGQAAFEGITYLPYQLVEGTSALALNAMDRITGGKAGDYWSIPTQAIVDNTGEVVHNGAKVHPEIGVQLNLWNMLINDEVQKEYAEDAAALERHQREGFQWLVSGMAHLGGSLVGFAPAAKAWELGSNTAVKGLKMLGQNTEKMSKMRQIVVKTSGAAIAGGMTDALAFGRHEGVTKAFTHGVIVTPLYLGLGALGRNRELALRKKMPKKVAQAIAGGMEGAGLGLMETAQLDPLWRFIREPSEDSWHEFGATMMKNILGMALIKGAGKGLPGEPSKVAEQVGLVSSLEKAIIEASREAATTKDPARREEILAAGEREGWSRQDMLELGASAARQEQARGRAPEEAGKLREEVAQKEKDAGRRRLELDEQPGDKLERAWRTMEAESKQQLYGERYGKPGDPEVSTRRIREEAYAERFQRPREEATRAPETAPAEPPTMGERYMGMRRLEAREPVPGEQAPPVSSRDFPAAGREAELRGDPAVERVRKSDIGLMMGGRPARKGVLGIGRREADPVVVTTRKKGFREEGIEGYLDTRDDIIRTREAQELNVMAHEWAHAMQKKMVGFDLPALERLLSPDAIREMTAIGEAMQTPRMNMSQRAAEGWAEFWARDLLGDRNLAREYPNLFRELTEWMGDPANRALFNQYARIKDGYTRWRAQGALARAIGEIEPGGERKSKLAKEYEPGVVEKVEKFMANLVDDAANFKRSYAHWMKMAGHDPVNVPITHRPGDLYDALRMTAPRVAERMIKYGPTDIAGQPVKGGKSLHDSLNELSPKEWDTFWAYMKRRRELEMMDQGLETGVSREEAMWVVSEYGNPKFERIANEMRQWFHGLVDYVAEAGGLSVAETAAIKDAYVAYMPFHRMHTGKVDPRGRPGPRGPTGPARMKGGGGESILNPVEAIRQMAVAMVTRAQRAMVLRSLYDHHALFEGVGSFITDRTRDIIGRDVNVKEFADALDKMEVKGDAKHELETAAETIRNLSEGNFEALTLFSQKTMPNASDPVLAMTVRHTPEQMGRAVDLKRDQLRSEGLGGEELSRRVSEFEAQLKADQGKVKWLELDPEAYANLMGINGSPTWIDNAPRILRTLATLPARTIRLFATTISAPFVIRNMMRDAVQQSMYTKHAKMAPLAGIKALLDGARTPKELRDQLAALGGGGLTFVGHEVTGPTMRRGQSEFAGQTESVGGTLKRWLGKWADFLGETEQWLRRKEFQDTVREVRNKGGTPFEAAMQGLLDAKEVTVNFTRGTALTRSLNQVIPYLNAGVQGTRKMTRHLLGYEGKQMQHQAFLYGATNITAMSALAYLLHGQEEWYRDLPQWRRMNYWAFKMPGAEDPFFIPKPFEVGKLFSVPFEMAADAAFADGEMGLELHEFAWEMAKGYFNGFQFLPAFLQTSHELAHNYSAFRGRPIVPEWMERSRLPKDQFNKYTTNAAKWIGESIGISPLKVEHAVGGYTAGAGLELMRAFDGVKGASQRGWPGTRSFIGQQHKQSRNVERLFQLDREISQARGSRAATPAQMAYADRVREAKEQIKQLGRAVDAGQVGVREANRRSYEIARDVVRGYERAER